MATSSNYEGALELTAPTGGITVGTPRARADQDHPARWHVAGGATTAVLGGKFVGKLEGIFHNVVKAAGTAWTARQTIYWDNSAGNFTTVSTSNTLVGEAAADATSAAVLGDVLVKR
jgi:predicted RecA/RadA family phage recombinase